MQNRSKIIISKQQDIHDYYWYLSQFLAQFAANVEFNIFDPEYVVKNSYEPCDRDYKEYQTVLSQANEIFEMDPFPYDAIEQATNLLISESKNEKEKSEEVKQWLRHALHLLELRVTGKL